MDLLEEYRRCEETLPWWKWPWQVKLFGCGIAFLMAAILFMVIVLVAGMGEAP